MNNNKDFLGKIIIANVFGLCSRVGLASLIFNSEQKSVCQSSFERNVNLDLITEPPFGSCFSSLFVSPDFRLVQLVGCVKVGE